jgi:hypothetical protein
MNREKIKAGRGLARVAVALVSKRQISQQGRVRNVEPHANAWYPPFAEVRGEAMNLKRSKRSNALLMRSRPTSGKNCTSGLTSNIYSRAT